MNKSQICFLVLCMSLVSHSAWALKGKIATEADVLRLKQDLANDRIKVGLTRLNNIRNQYGDALNITSNERKITYDYDDLKIDFEKNRYMKDWAYDSFKKPAYTDDIQKLRKDLEGQEIVGENITYEKIVKDYGEPTESLITEEDGAFATFYWGDIKITFENVIAVTSWKGSNLGGVVEEPVTAVSSIVSKGKEPVAGNKAAPAKAAAQEKAPVAAPAPAEK